MSKIDTLLSGQELSDEFKAKLTEMIETIEQEADAKYKELSEAQIAEKVAELEEQNKVYIEEELIPKYEAMNESYIEQEIVPYVNDYISAGVAKFIESKKVSIQESLKVEIAESVIDGVKALLAQHNIDIPEGTSDIIAESQQNVETIQSKLDESVSENVELRKQIIDLKKVSIIGNLASDLTESQIEKLTDHTMKLEFIGESEFKDQVSAAIDKLGFKDDVEGISEEVVPTQINEEQETKLSYLDNLVKQITK